MKMNWMRRQMLKDALAAAILLATPASLYAAVRRKASERFIWVRLKRKDSFLAIDRFENDRALLLTKKEPLADRSYKLKDGRTLEVQGGRLAKPVA